MRIVTINMQGSNPNMWNTLFGWFKRSNSPIDFACLQECGAPPNRMNISRGNPASVIIGSIIYCQLRFRRTDTTIYLVRVYWQRLNMNLNSRCSLGILSRHKPVRTHYIPPQGANRDRLRGALVAEFGTPSRQMIIASIHASAAGLNASQQDGERLVNAVNNYRPTHVADNSIRVIGGDFNHEKTTGNTIGNHYANTACVPNSSTHQSGRCLDYFFTNITAPKTISVLGSIGSDHWPVQIVW